MTKVSPQVLNISGSILTQANAGSAGGTMNYVNMGGLKILFATSATVNLSAGTLEFSFTLPSGFFTATPVAVASALPLTADASMRANISAISNSFINSYVTAASTATGQIKIIAIGT